MAVEIRGLRLGHYCVIFFEQLLVVVETGRAQHVVVRGLVNGHGLEVLPCSTRLVCHLVVVLI